MASRSITLPIVFASIAVALSIALLVGWILVIAQNTALTEEVAQNVWLMVLGILSFVFIMAVIVVVSAFLAREIQEVRRQNSFIDSVTHELKSPLASIKLCLETMDRDGLSAEQREILRGMMFDDVSRLSSFIDDVLQASRIAYQRRGTNFDEVSVRTLACDAVHQVASRHKIEESRFEVHVPSEIRLRTDRVALEVIVRNLLDNAVKYSHNVSDDRALVVVRFEIERGRPVLSVQDYGIGISRIHLKRIFERFYRAPEENVHTKRGTGLGLFVVAALSRNIGARVRAASEGAQKGTTIYVEFERSHLAESAAEVPPVAGALAERPSNAVEEHEV